MERTLPLKLVEEYLRLGGHRRAVLDDNDISTRSWEKDTPEAAAFWKEKIETLEPRLQQEVETLLPTINAT